MRPSPSPLALAFMLPGLVARTAFGVLRRDGCAFRHAAHAMLWGPEPGYHSPCATPARPWACRCVRVCCEPPLFGCGRRHG